MKWALALVAMPRTFMRWVLVTAESTLNHQLSTDCPGRSSVLFSRKLVYVYFLSTFLCGLCTANNQIRAKPRRNLSNAFRSVVSAAISGKQVFDPRCYAVKMIHTGSIEITVFRIYIHPGVLCRSIFLTPVPSRQGLCC